MSTTVDGLLKERNGAVWMCGKGHYLGLAVRKRSGGRWHAQLLKFRHAAITLADCVEVDAVIEGTVRDIACDACPQEALTRRTWFHVKDDGQAR
jgi:hypothetical protein